jgi:hypothetical protein
MSPLSGVPFIRCGCRGRGVGLAWPVRPPAADERQPTVPQGKQQGPRRPDGRLAGKKLAAYSGWHTLEAVGQRSGRLQLHRWTPGEPRFSSTSFYAACSADSPAAKVRSLQAEHAA